MANAALIRRGQSNDHGENRPGELEAHNASPPASLHP